MECGTAACAIGWGATLPQWQKAGFRMKHYMGSRYSLTPFYRRADDLSAVAWFLGINTSEALWTFYPDQYRVTTHIGPGHVVQRIDEILTAHARD